MEKQHTNPPNNDAESIPHLLLEALPLTMRILSAQMRETRHALSSAHLPVLAALDMKPRTQSELADMMSVSGATMSNTLTTLEERGWIHRERSREDRRLIHIDITEQGKRALHETIDEMTAHLARLFESLHPEERQRLIGGLQVLRDVFYAALGGKDQV
jgi:DNA-binding MarR family transcriptional regulator